jgi:hypothetical protein
MTDRTDEMQNLLDLGYMLPPGPVTFAGQLVLRDGWDNRQTLLKYIGPPREGGAVKVVAGSWGKDFTRLNLENVGSIGQGVGVGIGRDETIGQGGTQTGGCIFSGVGVSGFERGIHVGDTFGRAASELTFIALDTRDCDVGVKLEAQNTLNLTLLNYFPMNCRIGIDTGGAGNIHVIGGSASGVRETVVYFRQGGVFSLANFRAETSGRLAMMGDTSATVSVSIDNCLTAGMIRADGIDVWGRAGMALTVRNSLFEGYAYYHAVDDQPPGFGTVVMENVRTLWPYLLDGSRNGQCEYALRNCALVNSGREVQKRVNLSGILNDGPVPPPE